MLSKISLSKKWLLAIILYSLSGKIFAVIKDNIDAVNTIPFKPEHGPVNEAASSLPYVFLVLILLAFVLYFVSRKTGLFKSFVVDQNEQNHVKILQMKKITQDTIFFKVKIDDSEHIFLESKKTLIEIKSDKEIS